MLLLQAKLYKSQKKYKEAIRFYEKVKAKCDLEVAVYVDTAQCYHELGDIVESKRLLFQASKIENSNQGEVIALLKEYDFDEKWCVCFAKFLSNFQRISIGYT